jgi:class 3 adenylate cyclase
MRSGTTIFAALFYLVNFMATAQELAPSSKVLIIAGQERVDLIPYVEVMRDPTAGLEPSGILSGKFDSHFIQSLQGIRLEQLSIRGVYWFRFSISNTMGRSLRIKINAPEAQLFYKDDGGTIQRIDGLMGLGEDLEFMGVDLPDQSLRVLNAPRETTYYLRVEFPEIKASDIELSLEVEMKERFFLKDRNIEYFFYLGFLIAFILYNISVFFLVRDASNVYFLLYLFSFLASMILSFSGQGSFLSWEEYAWRGRLQHSIFNLIFIFLSLFSIRHMRFSEQFKWGKKVLWIICIVLGGIVVSSWFLPSVNMVFPWSVLLASFSLFAMVIGAIKVVRKFKYVRFVLASLFVTSVFYVILIFEFFRVVNPPFSSFYAMGVFQVFFFSLSVADRINMERSARNRILEEQNVTLEKKVVERTMEIRQEKEKSEKLLLNILPEETAHELREYGVAKPRLYPSVSVLFSDFKDFTSISEQLAPEKLVEEIDTCFRAFDEIMEKYGLEKIKTIGDAYMAASGLPTESDDHAERCFRAAVEVNNFMDRYHALRKSQGRLSFEVRIGIHSGPVVAGVVGTHKFQYDIWGDTVNLAARMEQSSEAGKINISEDTRLLLKGVKGLKLESRGELPVKNKGSIPMYFGYIEEISSEASKQ